MYFIASSTVMQANFTLSDFFTILLYVAGVAALVTLIAILLRAYKILGDVKTIIKENQTNITKILEEIPELSKNVSGITAEVDHLAKAFRPSVDNIADTTESITKTVKENNPINETILGAYKTVNNANKVVSEFKAKKDRPINITIDKDFKRH